MAPEVVFCIKLCALLILSPVFVHVKGNHPHVLPQAHLHTCNHKIPKEKEVIHDVQLEPIHVIRKRSVDQNLRIHLHLDQSLNNLPKGLRDLVQSKILKAIAYWEDTLKVRATRVPIRLNRKCRNDNVIYKDGQRYCLQGCDPVTTCGDIQIPEDHLQNCQYVNSSNGFSMINNAGNGVSGADFILYVATLSTQRCFVDQTIAYAAHCQLEAALDRPVAGYFCLCPNAISTNRHEYEILLSVLKHEILHSLGFTAGLYAFYRDSSGQPLTARDPINNKPPYIPSIGIHQWSDKVIKKFTRNNWKLKSGTSVKTVDMIITPNVVREARLHFNCSTLEGAELEDQGLNGTAITHWEKRVFENEAMTGTYTQNPVISRITLALMEDTGWYSVDYNNSEELEWGADLGCDFVQKSCFEWIETRQIKKGDIHPFCNEVRQGSLDTDCTRNRKAVALCNLGRFETKVPAKYQYFSSLEGVNPKEIEMYGGIVTLADYCPFLQEFVWKTGTEIMRGSRCSNLENSLGNYSLSGYSCESDTGLTIYVRGKPHVCHYEGQLISVQFMSADWLHTGEIICPACSEICPDDGTCPAEQKPVVTVDSIEASSLKIPCSAKSFMYGPYNSPIVILVAANLLYCMIIYFCYR
ncbi:hypothetical protein ACJMK2_022858 [Sinanodonta woodiana]|uniref:Leishmanolysin-like peptidase n=1 Tax=Sinanodonta woodiana TaxID=1069815 RepID=A0ABD3TLP9_SINWO